MKRNVHCIMHELKIIYAFLSNVMSYFIGFTQGYQGVCSVKRMKEEKEEIDRVIFFVLAETNVGGERFHQ